MYMFDYLVKVTTVGEASVGKSCLVNRFTTGRFTELYDITIGVDFATKTISTDYKGNKKKVKIQIWDTAGQESFRSITRSYYRNSAVVLLVFDVSNRDSFAKINRWLNEVRNMNTHCNPKVYLVGNKSDIPNREVLKVVAEEYATENGLLYHETSAKTGEGVKELFDKLSIEVVGDIIDGKYEYINHSGVKIREEYSESLKSTIGMNKLRGCC